MPCCSKSKNLRPVSELSGELFSRLKEVKKKKEVSYDM